MKVPTIIKLIEINLTAISRSSSCDIKPSIEKLPFDVVFA